MELRKTSRGKQGDELAFGEARHLAREEAASRLRDLRVGKRAAAVWKLPHGHGAAPAIGPDRRLRPLIQLHFVGSEGRSQIVDVGERPLAWPGFLPPKATGTPAAGLRPCCPSARGTPPTSRSASRSARLAPREGSTGSSSCQAQPSSRRLRFQRRRAAARLPPIRSRCSCPPARIRTSRSRACM